MQELNAIGIIPSEVIIRKIVILRNEKVMLDFDLAELYDVENRILKQAVRRNNDLFPSPDSYRDYVYLD